MPEGNPAGYFKRSKLSEKLGKAAETGKMALGKKKGKPDFRKAAAKGRGKPILTEMGKD